MPLQLKITVTEAEKQEIEKKAAAQRLTVSNLLRRLLGLPEIWRGAPAGNQNAIKRRTAKSRRQPKSDD